ncbi:putative membrane protein [Corynebacterium glutamicum MB001]|uniref:Hypothetical membrane protein n=1 Tax=Corynebacterium glutamicum (strain ATCC 13032 / DSM 20300 / JCM 1318 / BCRC 11384 / CCUG 27702 / LMG 3730 / NBRC 12168 / NCIMB 10025 / NRRL B-2784 / 534) TaxID=196627 RepID=Q8NRF7_CORGL|nr:DUF3592 domain-containing protein [Corynebacterium glutamicum]AGT05084.1 putative membrane protein [Corynebacterium glutamicum MB001]AIK84781.1 hypothetical protein CGLAR1_05825 [Corynebacterium glutamicum]AIK87565.1 hypothetical protein AR0_05960 [Corynebacterium glutamicum]ARV64746.1 hypothetical protein B7P23_07465 [Corynebacterium glutamicum]ASW13747.1 putative membrane protein [Corynebacterium glutamicum]
MLISLLIVLILGVVCIGIGIHFIGKDRHFQSNAVEVEAEVTGFVELEDERYLTQYRFELDHHEVFGVLPKSTPRPITTKGAVIPLLVNRDDSTQVRRLTARKDVTLRFFLILIGGLMVCTAVPLLFFVA